VQAIPQNLVAWRTGEEPVQQRAEIKTGSTRDDGKPAARADRGQRFPRQTGVFTSSEDLAGIHNVDEVVGNAETLSGGELGGAKVEMAVHLPGIAVDDLAVEFFRDSQGQPTFSGAGRPAHRNQRPCARISNN
jgi:hypothetical protein